MRPLSLEDPSTLHHMNKINHYHSSTINCLLPSICLYDSCMLLSQILQDLRRALFVEDLSALCAALSLVFRFLSLTLVSISISISISICILLRIPPPLVLPPPGPGPGPPHRNLRHRELSNRCVGNEDASCTRSLGLNHSIRLSSTSDT